MGQVGDKALGAVHAGSGGLKVIVIPQLQPDVAVTLVIHHHALLALHWLHGGISDQIAGFGVEHLQSAVLVVKGDGVTHDAGSVQRCHLTGNKVVQFIAEVAVGVPCDHIPREIIAGPVVKCGDQAPVLGRQVPQFIFAVLGAEGHHAVAADLLEISKAFTGGGVVERLGGGRTGGGVGVQFHPAVQLVRRIGDPVGIGGVGTEGLGAVPGLDDDPAVQVYVVVPLILGKACRAGVAVEHQIVPADDAVVSAFRHRQALAGGKVDDLTGTGGGGFVDAGVFMQHQQAVLQGGTLFAVKGHHFAAFLIVKSTAAAALTGGV